MADTEQNAPGRPTVITPEVLQKLEQAFAFGATDREAAFYADISERTLYNYCSENPEFGERKENLKEQPVLRARQTVVNAIEADPALAFKYLERRKKDEFAPRSEVTGAEGQPLYDDGGKLDKALEMLENATIVQDDPEPAGSAGDSQGAGSSEL